MTISPERIERALEHHDWLIVETLVDFAAVGDRAPGRTPDDAITAAVHLTQKGRSLGGHTAAALGLSGQTLQAISAYVHQHNTTHPTTTGTPT